MDNGPSIRCTAFEGYRRIASGDLLPVALTTKEVIDKGEQARVLIFDDVTGEQIELDFRGTADDVRKRLAQTTSEGASTAASAPPDKETPRGPGRPKLGVVAREVTLLPRHWDWLNSQPGGASVALRKLGGRGQAQSTKVRIAFAARKRPLIGSCPPWRGTYLVSRKRRAPCSQATRSVSIRWSRVGQRMFRDHARKLAATAFSRQQWATRIPSANAMDNLAP